MFEGFVWLLGFCYRINYKKALNDSVPNHIIAEKIERRRRKFMKTRYVVAILLMCLPVIIGSITLAQPPSFDLEKEKSMWSDEHWRTIVIGAEGQMVTMLNHLVDAGFPPRPSDMPILEAEGYTLSSTGGFAVYWYAINNRVGKAPLDDVVFRQALAYAMDREDIVANVYGPLSMPLYSFVPPAQGWWYNYDVEEAFPRFNLQLAIDTLVGGGYTPVDAGDNPITDPQPGNIDHWHMPGTTTNIRDLEQGVPSGASLPLAGSLLIEADLQEIGLPIYHTPILFDDIVASWLTPPYMSWDLTYGIGLTFGVDPTLDLLLHSNSIPFANIWGIENQTIDDACDAMLSTLSWTEAQEQAYIVQECALQEMPFIPMQGTQRYTANTGPYGEEPGVLGWVNMIGYGGLNTANDFGRLYSRREYEDGSPYAIQDWLMGEQLAVLNPLTSETAYEWALMSPLYTSLIERHPYTHELFAWCVEEAPKVENGLLQLWNGTHRTTGTTMPPEDRTWIAAVPPAGSPGLVSGEYMLWTLRDDLVWHDGEPVTTADVEFVWDLVVNQNNERYASIHQYMHDIVCVNDYTFEVYFTGCYLWADNDVSGISLLAPEHIWKGYIAGEDGILWTADDEDHRYWQGHLYTDTDWYNAPTINTPSGTVQLTHLQGNGFAVFPLGGWVVGTSIHDIRWSEDSWHFTRVLRADPNFDGIADVLDLWYPLYAFGTYPGHASGKWRLEADMANPASLIDGRDIDAIYNDWGYYWYPYSTLPA